MCKTKMIKIHGMNISQNSLKNFGGISPTVLLKFDSTLSNKQCGINPQKIALCSYHTKLHDPKA